MILSTQACATFNTEYRRTLASKVIVQNTHVNLYAIRKKWHMVALLGVALWLTLVAMPAYADAPTSRALVAPNGARLWLRSEGAVGEIWLADAGGAARRVLALPGEVVADAAWSPDGQSVAFIRAPLGSETDALTEVWRLDVAENRLTRLTQNNFPDHSPRWSADGQILTVQQGAKTISLPANRLSVDDSPAPVPQFTSAPRIALPENLTAPATIRVMHHSSNSCRSYLPAGHIDYIPFEEYVKRVTPHESPASWPAASLQAQAVAARTYAWDKIRQNAWQTWDVTDWTNYQYMCDNTDPRTDAAVDATKGEYLSQNGVPITAMYSAENSSPTKSSRWVTYLRAIEDPVSFARTLNGHGYGMGQWGAYRWAAWYGWDYTAILRHYYSNVTVEASAAASDSAPPKVAFIQPWHNRYITGNRLWVQTNVTDDWVISDTRRFLTVLTDTQLLPEVLENISALPDMPLNANAPSLTADVTDWAGKTASAPVVNFGIDRVDPVARWVGGSGSLVVTPTLSATDTTSGVAWLAFGEQKWAWEGETFTRSTGQVVTDAAALNGSAVRATVVGDIAGSWSRADFWLPGSTAYRAYVRLKSNFIDTSNEVVEMKVWANGTVIGLHRLRGIDFRAANEYQEFGVDFLLPSAGGSVTLPFEIEIDFLDEVDISFDRLVIVEYPIPFRNTLPSSAPADVRIKVIDAAGNVSADVSDVLATPPPTPTPVPTATPFTPFAWVYLPLILK